MLKTVPKVSPKPKPKPKPNPDPDPDPNPNPNPHPDANPNPNPNPKQEKLPFEVDGLADLCARNPRIRNVYTKCAHVGFPPNGKTDLKEPDLTPAPRPRCRSVGANVPFIAHVRQGGTISCDEERDADWDPETADRPGTLP